MKRAMFFPMVLLGCSPSPAVQQGAAPASEESASEVPVAPAAEVVSIRIMHDRNGQTVEVPIGRPFSVELRGEQPQGFSWLAVETPEFIALAPDGTATLPEPEERAEEQPIVGVGGMQTFFFVATAPGSGDLVLEHRRFGGALPTRDSFRVRIVAR